MYLPLANILYHKLGSVLNAFGIGVGICMLITLTGLSRGSLFEVADRMESINADLMVVPAGLTGKTMTLSGVALPEKIAPIIKKRYPDLVDRAVPVSIGTLKLAGQDQRVTGLAPKDWDIITGNREIEGRIFDPESKFANWIETELLAPAASDDDEDAELVDLSNKLSAPGRDGLEIVIDRRLANAGKYKIGDKVDAASHTWTIVGIVDAGVTTRVFTPLRTAQYLFGTGDITKCTMIFLKLKPGTSVGPTRQKLAKELGLDVLPLEAYRGELMQKFGVMFTYVDAVNIIALTIAFLFVMITLYTMVLQRTREIAILKSCGSSNFFILRQIVSESLILTGLGTAVGIGMSFGAAWGIQTFKPLLTVQITPQWILAGVAAAICGAVLAALYPAWRAMRVDMVEALTYE